MKTNLFSNFCVLIVGLVVGTLKSYSRKTCIGKSFLCRLCYRLSSEGVFFKENTLLCRSDSETLVCVLTTVPGYEAKNIYASNYGVCLIKLSYFKYLKHFPLNYITMECCGKERLKLWFTYAEFLLLQQLISDKIFFRQRFE